MSPCPNCGEKHAAENHFCPVTGKPIELGPRLISQNLLERFRVVTILGEGPIGIVVEVEELGTGKRHAAKLIHPQFSRHARDADKLLDDAKRSGTLGSRHIAEVVEVGYDTGAALTVVRELMTGQCLEARLEELGRLNLDEAVEIAREILIGLDAIHNTGLVNLDLSPADVFLAEEDGGYCVKIVDIGERHIKQEIVLETNGGFDSVNFYAPEQFDRGRQINPRSDIYAAGAILYQMVTGVVPSPTPEPVNTIRKGIPFQLAKVIHTALASTPHNRFASAGHFIEALDRVSAEMSDAGASGSASMSRPESGSVAEDDRAEKGSSVERVFGDITPEVSVADQYQPSVIVDMPEMERRYPLLYTKKFRVGLVVGVCLLALGAVAVLVVGQKWGVYKKSNDITISVSIDPPEATVTIDGQRVEGNPASITVFPDDLLHTISAKADGFEPLERDVVFDQSRTVELALVEIITPDEDTSANEMENGEAKVEIGKPAPSKLGGAEKPAAQEEGVRESARETLHEAPREPAKTAESKPKTEQKRDRHLGPKRPAPTVNKKKPKPAPKKDTVSPKAPSKPRRTREGFNTRNPFG